MPRVKKSIFVWNGPKCSKTLWLTILVPFKPFLTALERVRNTKKGPKSKLHKLNILWCYHLDSASNWLLDVIWWKVHWSRHVPPPIHWFELATGFEISDWLSIGSSLFQIGFQQDELLNHSFHRRGRAFMRKLSPFVCLSVTIFSFPRFFVFFLLCSSFPWPMSNCLGLCAFWSDSWLCWD